MNTQRETIFITGTVVGIGLAAARHFYQLGYIVGMADLNLSIRDEVIKQVTFIRGWLNISHSNSLFPSALLHTELMRFNYLFAHFNGLARF
jgi:short-subunit dehydrogenase involved in D-alanine esterification of teichoic acids